MLRCIGSNSKILCTVQFQIFFLCPNIFLAAETIAEFIYQQAYDGGNKVDNPNLTINRSIVNELLYCYVVTAKCSLYNLSSTVQTPPTAGFAPDSPYPQYVGVYRSTLLHTYMIGNLLAYLTGETVTNDIDSQKACNDKEDKIWNYYYLKNTENCDLCKETDSTCDSANVTCGVCKKTASFNKAAISPAFLIEVIYARYHSI